MDGPRTLFVASTGGHLEELLRLRDRLDPAAGAVHWATADTEQSRELLDGESVSWMPVVPSKDLTGAIACLPRAVRIMNAIRPERVISTGAALALPFFVAARARRVSCHYVESAARSTGPSLTGRLADWLPGVHLYTQYPGWASDKWRQAGSVFDGFEVTDPVPVREGGVQRVVVTLGTQRGFPFRRSLEALVRVLPEVCAPGAEILWQTGATDPSGLGIDARATVPPRTLKEAVERADLVIAHAGVGSALCALDAGRVPVLVPRRHAFGEHTDDHQVLIAAELERRGLAVHAELEELSRDHLLRAAAGRVVGRQGELVRLAGSEKVTQRKDMHLKA